MGAGFHGGFGATQGTKQHYSPISTQGDVRYSKKKTEGYLLNSEHPQGAGKAKFMKEVLGYGQGDSKIFHKNVVDSIIGKMPDKIQKTQYGTKYTYNTTLKGKDGSNVSAKVVVVIQKDKGRKTYKLVTVYPDKGGDK